MISLDANNSPLDFGHLGGLPIDIGGHGGPSSGHGGGALKPSAGHGHGRLTFLSFFLISFLVQN